MVQLVGLAVLTVTFSHGNRTRSPDTAALLRGLASTLGVLQQAPRVYLQCGLDATAIEAAIAARHAAKAAKNYGEADRIRKELLGQGIELKDSPQGTTWVKA